MGPESGCFGTRRRARRRAVMLVGRMLQVGRPNSSSPAYHSPSLRKSAALHKYNAAIER